MKEQLYKMIISRFQGVVAQDFVLVVCIDMSLVVLVLSSMVGILIVFNRPDGLVPITTDEKKTPR